MQNTVGTWSMSPSWSHTEGIPKTRLVGVTQMEELVGTECCNREGERNVFCWFAGHEGEVSCMPDCSWGLQMGTSRVIWGWKCEGVTMETTCCSSLKAGDVISEGYHDKPATRRQVDPWQPSPLNTSLCCYMVEKIEMWVLRHLWDWPFIIAWQVQHCTQVRSNHITFLGHIVSLKNQICHNAC